MVPEMKKQINKCTERCISEDQIPEFRIILAGIAMQSLNLKASIGWPFVTRVSIPKQVIELRIQYGACLLRLLLM